MERVNGKADSGAGCVIDGESFTIQWADFVHFGYGQTDPTA